MATCDVCLCLDFENGDLESVKPFLSDDVHEAFAEVVAAREREGLKVEATFVGLGEVAVRDASFDADTREGEIAVRFTGELTYVVRNAAGEIVEGSTSEIKRQRDVWTFGRVMGTEDPNWKLVATGE